MKENILIDKSIAFAARIVKLHDFLIKNKKGLTIAKQVIRSGTSIGANVRESYNAQSKADFINKLHIALKEADETAYWLELLYESDIINKQYFDSLYGELKEIIALLTASIKTLKNNETKK
mgnify:CR=1 FL=1